MGLIYPQAVKIRPAGKSKYYEQLGYNIPQKIGSVNSIKQGKEIVIDKNGTIEVDINDLPPNSTVLLWYNCDLCGELNYISKSNYTKRHTNPYRPLYCFKCTRSVINAGPNHYHWNPNITNEERLYGRNYAGYVNFVKRVLARDEYKCQVCGNNIDATGAVHHLNGYNWDKQHRLDDNNGITLCGKCHETFHKIYGKGYNTKEQFEEWIGSKLDLKNYNGGTYVLPKIYCIEDDIIYEDRFDAAHKIGCSLRTIKSMYYGESYTYHGKHYISYQKYLSMSQDEINNYLTKGKTYYRNDKRVLCITTGLLFDNSFQAGQMYKIKQHRSIHKSCYGQQKHTGLYNNFPLQWLWYTDFTALPPHEQLQIALNNKETLQEGSFLYELLYCNDKKDLLSPTTPLNSITTQRAMINQSCNRVYTYILFR